jgi:hypothetical protein
MLEMIEQAMVARLAAQLPNLSVEPFPDNPGAYKLNHPMGALLVNYHGSDYRDPESTDAMIQERKADWDITLQLRNLRSHVGAYPVIESIRAALQGWGQNEVGAAFWMVSDKFVDVLHGVWVYRIVVRHKLMAVPVVSPETEAEANAVLCTQVTASNSALGEEIIIPRINNG